MKTLWGTGLDATHMIFKLYSSLETLCVVLFIDDKLISHVEEFVSQHSNMPSKFGHKDSFQWSATLVEISRPYYPLKNQFSFKILKENMTSVHMLQCNVVLDNHQSEILSGRLEQLMPMATSSHTSIWG